MNAETTRANPWKIAARAGIAVIAIAAALWWFTPRMFDHSASANPFDDAEFNQALWLEHRDDAEMDNPRGPMFDDLVKNHLRPGMTRPEVVALLGEPDLGSTYPPSSGEVSDPGSEDFYRYNLGFWSGLRMDPDSLGIQFNAQGRVESFSRSQH